MIRMRASPGPASNKPGIWSWGMGLVTSEWRCRSALNGGAAWLASVAAVALSAQLAHAQQAQPAGQQTDQATQDEQAKALPPGATLLDKILVVSRTGETAI